VKNKLGKAETEYSSINIDQRNIKNLVKDAIVKPRAYNANRRTASARRITTFLED